MKEFLKKIRIPLIIVGVLIVLCIILAAVKPSREQLEAAVPAAFSQLESKKVTETYRNAGIMNSYIITNQISSTKAARVSVLGIAGQVLVGEVTGLDTPDVKHGAVVFVINCTNWIPSLLSGARITILLTICAVTCGLLLGAILALGKMSKRKVLHWFCEAYIFFFRGTPLLMQLFFVYYGLPLIHPALAINNRFAAAWVAFALNSGAYCSEIFRAAIQSIDKGQFEAAKALGFSYGKTMRKIIIPQTYRRLIPPVANEFIMVLKDASLTSIIALQDLSKMTQSIMTSTSNVTIYIPSMIIYLIITGFFTWMFGALEKKFSVYE